MSSNDIRGTILTVLKRELVAYSTNGRQSGGLGSFNLKVYGENLWQAQGQDNTRKLLADTSRRDIIQSENAEVLIRFHASLDMSKKEEFKQEIQGSLSNEKYSEIAYLPYFVLHRIGETAEALLYARNYLKWLSSGQNKYGYDNLLSMATQVLYYEYDFIPNETLDAIEKFTEGEHEYAYKLPYVLNEIKFRRLKHMLYSGDCEINTDKDKLISTWERLYPESPDVPRAIEEVEELFKGGEFNNQKYATAMGRVRVLIAKAIFQLTNAYLAKQGKPQLKESLDENAVLQTFRQQNNFADPEYKLVKAIYDFCSSEGAHSLKAPRENARIAKNISYEMLLLAAERSKS